ERSLRIELHVQDSGCCRLRADVFKKFLYVDVFGLNSREHFAVRRTYGRIAPQIPPHEWDGNIARRKFRLSLVELNFGDLQGLALCLGDRLKIHVLAGEKDNWHVESIRRIGRVDIRPERLQIAITAFLKNKLQFSRIL